jgi:hypothetical protein
MLFEIIYPNGDVEIKRNEDLATIIDGEVKKAMKFLQTSMIDGVCGMTLRSGVYVGVKQEEQQ